MKPLLVCLLALLLSCQNNPSSAPSPRDSATGLPWWNDSMQQNTTGGYIDTFSVAGNRFRLVHHDCLFDGQMEKWVADSWQPVFALELLGNHNGYDRKEDVNGDGFPDFQFHWKWDAEVYFYLPDKGTFSDTPLLNYFRQWALLDTTGKIYRGWRTSKFQNGFFTLFTFRNNKPYYLYYIQLYPVKKDYNSIGKIVLYKCIDGSISHLFPIKKIPFAQKEGEEGYFDGEAWLDSNYRSILQQKVKVRKKGIIPNPFWEYDTTNSRIPGQGRMIGYIRS